MGDSRYCDAMTTQEPFHGGVRIYTMADRWIVQSQVRDSQPGMLGGPGEALDDDVSDSVLGEAVFRQLAASREAATLVDPSENELEALRNVELELGGVSSGREFRRRTKLVSVSHFGDRLKITPGYKQGAGVIGRKSDVCYLSERADPALVGLIIRAAAEYATG